ncbi:MULTISPECIES: helix-turn-helix domain-containing protein [Haloferax]|jgi:predicted DNA binding protein|uniref:Helix-turn-helix domain-containing protein n=4 Tax=Haloferax TaxID=2251 RepID=A0A6C0UTP0_HALVO|nr:MULTISPECIES: helix-turn-helix domain-containing protein [Haloferax]ELZ61837.1 transcriptional regulator [Haloferax sp. ATCC BAA-646]ELZ61950.1 transcriptional regulator [Haloferax sp. ATCC BAA-645]ELZ70868.1 transcriptional regulator [Haloferax sp. ATCC BAA-644]ELZ77528.1 transcriptional regulator [Haloferax lucentense DSM 14919]ELZ95652.1 transcriptional regulator [Haloferax alexandrinus JCM 10717]
MSLITVADIAHDDLALTPTIQSEAASEIDVISQSATDPETGLFFFVVKGADVSAFEAALEVDHTVSDWQLVSEREESAVYRIGHTPDTILLSPIITELGGLMLDACSNDTAGWRVRLQLSDREALSEVWEYCEANDISFELNRMFRQDGWMNGEPSKLTDAQRDALVAAYEHGYFEEPREAALDDLSEVLDISPTAVSGRIRRGTAELVESILLDE